MKKYVKKSLISVLGATVIFGIAGTYMVDRQHVDIRESDALLQKNTKEIFVSGCDKYFLIVSEGKICAYRVNGENRELLNCGDIDPMLINGDELKSLSAGIYANSFEELCMYFEAYSS